ncbi:MAG: ribosomal-protein-alanine N-acetyltransferase [Flavobacteriales bacterium]|jgi:ribosomal-protein-alanine N-acetyltransferase
MIHTTESDRLILRELKPDDAQGIFELDSNANVHLFLGNKPISTLEQAQGVVEYIRQQYRKYGVGRLAVEEKESGRFIGWAGLKWMDEEISGRKHYHDLGYRFIEECWGKGYATEAALMSLKLAFDQMNLDCVCAMADVKHGASNAVLSKIGMKNLKTIEFDGEPHHFYEITKNQWLTSPLNNKEDLA